MVTTLSEYVLFAAYHVPICRASYIVLLWVGKVYFIKQI